MVGVAGRGVCKKKKKKKGGGEEEERKLAMMRVVEVGVGGQEGGECGKGKGEQPVIHLLVDSVVLLRIEKHRASLGRLPRLRHPDPYSARCGNDRTIQEIPGELEKKKERV